jgi:hypothetical protein
MSSLSAALDWTAQGAATRRLPAGRSPSVGAGPKAALGLPSEAFAQAGRRTRNLALASLLKSQLLKTLTSR